MHWHIWLVINQLSNRISLAIRMSLARRLLSNWMADAWAERLLRLHLPDQILLPFIIKSIILT